MCMFDLLIYSFYYNYFLHIIVWYHIVRGCKIFIIVPPTKRNLELYEVFVYSNSNSNSNSKFKIQNSNSKFKIQNSNSKFKIQI